MVFGFMQKKEEVSDNLFDDKIEVYCMRCKKKTFFNSAPAYVVYNTSRGDKYALTGFGLCQHKVSKMTKKRGDE